MRAIWKGSISFGLVNIPIALHNASRVEELKFRLLRRTDLSPVNYKRVAQADGKEVPWDDIVKGYEYEKGQFVVLKEEDFKRVDIDATDTIDINLIGDYTIDDRWQVGSVLLETYYPNGVSTTASPSRAAARSGHKQCSCPINSVSTALKR